MLKTIIIYYSNNGSNRFLANKMKDALSCDIEQIQPVVNIHFFLLLGLTPWIKKVATTLSDYERVILVGPIWMGKFVTPLKSFVNRYKSDINELVFVTCCGSSFKQKDDKFGHGRVFKEVEETFGRPLQCEAFPITLVIPENKQEDSQTVMATRLNNQNFKEEIVVRFRDFIEKMKK